MSLLSVLALAVLVSISEVFAHRKPEYDSIAQGLVAFYDHVLEFIGRKDRQTPAPNMYRSRDVGPIMIVISFSFICTLVASPTLRNLPAILSGMMTTPPPTTSTSPAATQPPEQGARVSVADLAQHTFVGNMENTSVVITFDRERTDADGNPVVDYTLNLGTQSHEHHAAHLTTVRTVLIEPFGRLALTRDSDNRLVLENIKDTAARSVWAEARQP